MVVVCGPAVAALEAAFGRMWAHAGRPLPDDDTAPAPDECGPSAVRVVEGVPGQSRIYRAVQLLAAAVTERLWITDAYLVAPPPLYASFVDAARSGVDVRMMLPGTSDIPIVRIFTRGGYRELLHAGARIFEYRGPMIHAKTLVGDHEWARVGSSNLNVSSLLGNYELDLVAEHDGLTTTLAKQFLHDMTQSREIVLMARRHQDDLAALGHVVQKLFGERRGQTIVLGDEIELVIAQQARDVEVARSHACPLVITDEGLGVNH